MSRHVRVGMNLLWLRPGVVGGSEVAAVSTVDALARSVDAYIELAVYAQRTFAVAHPDLVDRVGARTIAIPGGTRGLRVVAESTWLPWAVRRDRIDVVHGYGGVVPPRLGRPSVLTIHDLQPLEPGSAFASTKKAWLARVIPASVARAAAVTVPSEFVRDRMIDLLGTDPAKIHVIPHGRDVAMTTEPTDLPDAALIRRRFRLEGPFVLYPAITYPHKNHATLLRAFAELAGRNDEVTLVLAGGVGACEHEIGSLIESTGIGPRIRRVGRVTTAERDVLLREAAVLAFPSRYEGFGLPVVEAYGVDTPVVASRAGSLPEVVGDAGVLVDPDDVGAWADALEAAIDGGQSGAAATARRAEQAARFDWDHAAARLVELYRRAAQTGECGR